MSKGTKTVVAANIVLVLLIFIVAAHAQRPPELDSTGAAYLRVNINPTNVPPMVNVNPNGAIPHVNINQMPAVSVAQMPTVRVAAAGCQNREGFQTGISRSISGPLVVTYLVLPPQGSVTLNDGSGSHSMTLNQAGQITTAIYLRAGQGLSFNTDVMYSGCRPE